MNERECAWKDATVHCSPGSEQGGVELAFSPENLVGGECPAVVHCGGSGGSAAATGSCASMGMSALEGCCDSGHRVGDVPTTVWQDTLQKVLQEEDDDSRSAETNTVCGVAHCVASGTGNARRDDQEIRAPRRGMGPAVAMSHGRWTLDEIREVATIECHIGGHAAINQMFSRRWPSCS